MFLTHRVRLLSGVNAQVALQGLQVAEAGATGVAGVWLLARMDQNMGPQMGNLQHQDKPHKKGEKCDNKTPHQTSQIDSMTQVLYISWSKTSKSDFQAVSFKLDH